MKSKAQAYLKTMGMDTASLPQKYQENFEAMRDFEEILDIAAPGSEDYREALAEWEDYDEQILAALKKDYPAQQGYGGTLRWNWVREGEEVRVDWDHPERYVDGRYYIMLPKPAEGKLATYEKVGEGDIEFPGQDKRIQELLARAPQWVKAKTPNPEEKEGLANVNREFRQHIKKLDSERTGLPDSLPFHFDPLHQRHEPCVRWHELRGDQNGGQIPVNLIWLEPTAFEQLGQFTFLLGRDRWRSSFVVVPGTFSFELFHSALSRDV